MTDKKPAGASAPAQAEAAKIFTIEQLRNERKISRAVFAGVCAAQGWKPGKTVTEAEVLEAVQKFTSAPMSGATHKKEAKK